MQNRLAQDLDHVLDHTREIWADLRGERIFITGGTGFVGTWLLESLLWANRRMHLGVRAFVLTRNPQAFVARSPHLACDEAVQLVRGDVRTFAFPEGSFPFAIHGATQANEKLNREQPLTMLETIVDGTRRTLDFAAAAGTRRFLLISSGAVYGKQPPTVSHVQETCIGCPDPIDPTAAYAEGKRVAELLCRLYAQNRALECTIARCFAFVGPHLPLDAHFAIGNFIGDCLANRTIAIRGDGTPLRSYLYAVDLAIWLWTILLRGAPCRPYNVGSERELSIRELAVTVAAALGSGNRIEVACTPQPGVAPERYVPSTERARRELGLDQWIEIDEAIRRTAHWHSLQAMACEEVRA
jgi:nucleoside-diphosphate-sugar epimerase